MLLTLTTTDRPATDLGYLLHKHPQRVQSFEQSYGTAHVFYPEATEERCTAALLLEVDQRRLARSPMARSGDFSLGQYVNDRSDAAGSLLGVALGKVFATARSGRCDSRPELAAGPIGLDIELPVVPCRGGPELARSIFAPLGWEVEATSIPLDERFPEWGDSPYVRLRLRGRQRLADALNQLHVLLAVLDESKHYWQATDEVDKLLRSGGEWLRTHPERELITRRYLARSRELTHRALDRLVELDGTDEASAEATTEETTEATPVRPLNRLRRDAVTAALIDLGARSVIDLGCGNGELVAELVRHSEFDRVVGTDVSVASLRRASRRLGLDDAGDRLSARVELFQSALTYSDERFAGFDAGVLMEVIEHVDPIRLPALEEVVFGAARPGAVLVTTPNREYNVRYGDPTRMRHPDHRFEWDRAEFGRWGGAVAERYGYRFDQRGIGDDDPALGSPTQLGVFVRG